MYIHSTYVGCMLVYMKAFGYLPELTIGNYAVYTIWIVKWSTSCRTTCISEEPLFILSLSLPTKSIYSMYSFGCLLTQVYFWT